MKTINMFITSWCPYCKQALSIMDKLEKENPKYEDIEVKVIDEELEPEISKQYDYYYVPTYFVGSEKIHEGVPSEEIIRKVFETALNTRENEEHRVEN